MRITDFALYIQSKHKWSGSTNKVCKFSCGSSGLQLSRLPSPANSQYLLNSWVSWSNVSQVFCSRKRMTTIAASAGLPLTEAKQMKFLAQGHNNNCRIISGHALTEQYTAFTPVNLEELVTRVVNATETSFSVLTETT